MKVNSKYFVSWRYETNPDVREGRVGKLGSPIPLANDGDIVETTTCTIFDDKNEPIATGQAFRVFPDSPNKDIGRKLSMTRALESFTDRIERRAFWEAYRTLTENPRW